MFFTTKDKKFSTPNKLICDRVLYDLNTAEELASTRTKKDTSWQAVYQKKNREIFLAFIEKDDEDGELYLNNVITKVDDIENFMSNYFSIKQYEAVFGKVEE